MSDENRFSAQRIDLLFLGNFVHQVVNSINGVMGTLDNIVDETYPQNVGKQKLNAARGQLGECINLVKNIAFFSEVSSEVPRLAAPTNSGTSVLPQIVIEAAQFFQESAVARGMKILLTDRITQYKIKGRPEALRQVFINLIDNAVKYGLANTQITIEPHVQNKSGSLRVDVINQGIGFQQDEAEKIFGLGYRSTEAKNNIALGTGLGLYICRRVIADWFNGEIKAEYSAKLRQSKLTLIFPAAQWSK